MHLWLRRENNPAERRTTITPGDAEKLIQAGFKVTVEKSTTRTFPDEEYERVGCTLVEGGSWRNAPNEAVICGLGAVEGTFPLQHRHVYFGYAFKNQYGWEDILSRFLRGGGKLYDMEYLVDESGRRLTAFGLTAGYIGMAAGVLAWCRQELQLMHIEIPPDMIRTFEKMSLLEHLKALLSTAMTFSKKTPKLCVLGPNGLVGRGAVKMAEALGLPLRKWGREDTRAAGEGPYPEIALEYDVLLNAIKLDPATATGPFLTEDIVRNPSRRLSVVVDVSCDVKNPKNPLPIYHSTTTFDKPTLRVLEKPVPLDVIAIPTLAALLPPESSRGFSAQLLPQLLALREKNNPVWSRAEQVFISRCRKLAPVALPRHNIDQLDVTLQQERLFKLHQLDNTAYNVTRAVKIVGVQEIDLEQIRSAVGRVVASQEMLRTSFHSVADASGVSRLVQAINADAESQTQKISILGLTATSDEQLHELVSAESRRPFDLSLSPLVRIAVVSLPTPGQHALVVTMHQIIADARSVMLLIRAITSSEEHSPKLQYADFAHWERNRWVVDRKFKYEEISPVEEKESWQEANVGFWKKLLDGSLHVLQLPTDGSRPATQDFDCAQASFSFGADLSSRLRALSANRVGGEYPLFVFLTAAFKVLLYRYCGEDDVIIGTTVSGRPMATVRELVGPFSNQLALRTFIHDRMSFHEVLDAVKDTVEGALGHQEVPFERLFEELRSIETDPKKTSSTHNVMFHVRFNSASLLDSMVNLPVAPFSPKLEEISLRQISSSYDLDVTLVDVDAHKPLGLNVTYNRNLFNRLRIDEFFLQYQQLLTQVAENTENNIISYSLVTDRARSLIPDPSLPLDSTWRGPIYEHFSKNAQREPERTAVVFRGEKISYGQLELVTNKFANYLIANGLKPGDVLAIYGHRSPAVVLAIMGILKAGCAYSMIDPAYPSLRIQQCLDIAKPRGWVRIDAAGTPPEDLQQYLNAIPGLLQVDLPQPLDALNNSAFKDAESKYPNVDVSAESVAVITFTSGSTGLPKGVMGRHGPLTHYYPWMSERFGIGREDRFSMCSGIAHDPLQRDIFTPLFFCAAVYIPTAEDIATPGRLSEWMKENDISVTCMTPALGQILTTIDNPTFTIDTLRNAFFVGDMLIKRDVLRLRRLCPNIRVINMYGSTETQRSVGYYVVEASDTEHLRVLKEVIPVGEGMKGCQVIILNTRMQLAGVGEVSEIYMRSHHLAKGYVGLDEQTREKFLKNPFTTFDGDRLYKTGDLGRYAPNGMLECFGRADDQVKIRGFRIELGEINATLSLHPSVKENVTVVREDTPGEKRLVSYVVPTDLNGKGERISGPVDTPALSKELRGFLASKLPSYMVPTYVVILRTMPLTPNGKINRGGLPAPVEPSAIPAAADTPAAAQSAPVRPLTATEDKLVRVWARVLSVPISGPEDNFFELGGHSVLATRLMFEMGRELKLAKQLPMQLLYKAPSIAAMATAIDALVAGGDAASAEKVDLSQEIVLDASIDPSTAARKLINDKSKAILLTGATGFLGAFLLKELLEQNSEESIVYCLVRADAEDDAMRRIQKTLTGHQLWSEKYASRIVAIAGDLAKPLLGLPAAKFDELAEKIDVVVHNGAVVHWLLPYAKMKPANVSGTTEVLRLCCKTRVKPLHYVSTTSVFETDHHSKLRTVYEDDPIATSEGMTGGYPQSKWVAEKLIQAARARGLPCSVYRPGYVTGDSENGVWNTDDFLCRMIKGCIQLKAAPLMPGATLDMSSVDYVCQTIAHLVSKHPEANKAYHAVNPSLYSYEALFNAVKSFGYELELIDYTEWRRRLIEAVGNNAENALSAMVTFFAEDWPEGLVNKPKYDNSLVQDVARRAKIACPQMQDVLPVYFSYLIRCGFVAPPPEVASNNLNIDWNMIGAGVQMLTRTNRH